MQKLAFKSYLSGVIERFSFFWFPAYLFISKPIRDLLTWIKTLKFPALGFALAIFIWVYTALRLRRFMLWIFSWWKPKRQNQRYFPD
jgi:hypothetical protein